MSNWNEYLSLIDSWFREAGSEWRNRPIPDRLISGAEYSLYSGGKRFRPLLSLLAAESFDLSREQLKPWCMAVELIHTYSLIHDDLPSMDNDDVRRGKPTLHRHIDEAQALLVGDAFLTEAFYILAKGYKHEPTTAVQLIELLSSASGWSGMVGGQSDDLAMMKLGLDDVNDQAWLKVHAMKTGALIMSATLAPAIIAKVDAEAMNRWKQIGEGIGLIFQMVDDLHDKSSLYQIWGEKELSRRIDEDTKNLLSFNEIQNSKALKELIDFNQKRLT